MAVYALGDRLPKIDSSAFVHPDAVIIGSVTIGPESTVWPHAVLRGDYGEIVVGAQTSVQDGTVVHATEEHPTRIGDRCVIGHLVHLEGCTIEDDSLVGSNSVVLHRAVVRSGALVGAGASFPPTPRCRPARWPSASPPRSARTRCSRAASTRTSRPTSPTGSGTSPSSAGSTDQPIADRRRSIAASAQLAANQWVRRRYGDDRLLPVLRGASRQRAGEGRCSGRAGRLSRRLDLRPLPPLAGRAGPQPLRLERAGQHRGSDGE